MPELAVSAALLFVAILNARAAADGFLVGYFGDLQRHFSAELVLHLLHGDVDVGIAQPAQQHFQGVRLAGDREAGVFLYDAR